MNIKVFLYLILFFMANSAYAEGDVDRLTNALQNGINAINQSVLPHTKLYGSQLFIYFIGAGFVYYGVQYFASGGSMSFVAGDLIGFVLKASIPYLFIVYNDQVTTFITNFFYGFSGLMLNNTLGTGLSTFPLWDLFKIPIDTISLVDKAIDENFAKLPPIEWYQVGLYLERVIDDLVATIVVGLLAFFFALAILIMIAQVVLGMILFAISLTFAPLMSVFAIGWIFSGLFQSWLSFMLSSGFILIVGSVLIKTAQAIITNFGYGDFAFLQVEGIEGNKTLVYNWANASIMLLFSIVIMTLSRQIQVIAGQIAGGSVPNIGSTGDNRGKGAGAGGGGSGGKGSKGTGVSSIGGGGSATTNPGGAMLSAAKMAASGGLTTTQAVFKTARTIAENGGANSVKGGLSALRASLKDTGNAAKNVADQVTKPYGS